MTPIDYTLLLLLVMRLFPHLGAVEASHVAYAHIMWHDSNDVDDTVDSVCEAQIRSIVEGKRLHVV